TGARRKLVAARPPRCAVALSAQFSGRHEERDGHGATRDAGAPRARDRRDTEVAAGAAQFPSNAASSAATSILTIFSMASVARLDRALSGLAIMSTSTLGVICHDTP